MTRRVTLADVSRAAGLGLATVSRALAPTPHPDVSQETRARVRAVADSLGYRPSGTARALRSGYRAVSVIVPDDAWGWWEPVVRSAVSVAKANDFHVLVQPIAGHDGGTAGVVETLANVPIEGLLLCGSADDERLFDAVRRLRIPAVAIDDASNSTLFPTVRADSFSGAFEAVSYLVKSGRTRIAYFGTADNEVLFARERYRGYREALVDSRLSVDPRLTLKVDYDPTAYVENALVRRFFERQQDVDAVFCEFDQLASNVFQVLSRLGFSVPARVAVVGFDDERIAPLLTPPLTTVRQPYEALGSSAIEILLELMRGNVPESSPAPLRGTLVKRESA